MGNAKSKETVTKKQIDDSKNANDTITDESITDPLQNISPDTVQAATAERKAEEAYSYW